MTLCRWESKAHKLCVDQCSGGCWREKQSTFKGDISNERQLTLKEYFRLVDLYLCADALFEEHQNTEDEDTFHFYWIKVTKAHQHMVDYKSKHKITLSELTKATQGVKVGSVAEAVDVGHKLLEGK